MSPSAKSAVRDVSRNPVFRMIARSGFAVNGMLHILIGLIAIGIALPGTEGGEADQSGALRQLATTPGGLFVLWASVLALVALGLFQLITLPLLSAAGTAKTWGRRVAEAAKAVVYLVLGATALIFALGGSTSGSDTSQTFSAGLIATPGGVFLLVAVGLTVGGFGIGFVAIAVRRGFRKLIVVPAGRLGRVVVRLGTVGYASQGLALVVVGVLFVVAAVSSDSAAASGLDGALKVLAGLPFGIVLLVAVGVGFLAYGLFLIARARLATL
ncbi:DUF1206 domain-containing protein [Herbiconiux sp. VKM Ac-1786]|uniref:DUF1206 domain-containing protein n=1 Tax=Herbiconiux sp. VKM Ac-1786 TaxID=2783824 RepID=UPI00188BB695|nr:DUF1206 domain-containing protein [Herbiconiux sp. VKM Ac-1786]MBF4574316.1 DUF1206 domain-containing protein [Herbiconiux sp. VKM Ac-1786]